MTRTRRPVSSAAIPSMSAMLWMWPASRWRAGALPLERDPTHTAATSRTSTKPKRMERGMAVVRIRTQSRIMAIESLRSGLGSSGPRMPPGQTTTTG